MCFPRNTIEHCDSKDVETEPKLACGRYVNREYAVYALDDDNICAIHISICPNQIY